MISGGGLNKTDKFTLDTLDAANDITGKSCKPH